MAVSVPVIACGGMGTLEHLVSVIREGHADAVAMADALHYKRFKLADMREARERAMSLKVTVVDYGLGNLFSVSRGIERCGGRVVLADKPGMLDAAELVILPGVGTFADGMAELRKRGLVDALKKVASDNRPLLGICLGMQMLLDTGKEFGVHEGLGIIPGTVESIPATGADGRPHKIPHIGWNALVRPAK